jgi:intracellular sulfur oxidation DsrE/DsrF family protein
MNWRMLNLVLLTLGVVAAGLHADRAWAESYYLEVSPTDRSDLAKLFDAIEGVNAADLTTVEPVVVVLHGTEAAFFTRNNYLANKLLVDRAALLDAQRLIDVRMCETWMNANDVRQSDLPAFIDTVPYAPEEIDRLTAEGYLLHPSVQI